MDRQAFLWHWRVSFRPWQNSWISEVTAMIGDNQMDCNSVADALTR